MARDLSRIDPDRTAELSRNAYYQKVQQELREKSTANHSDERKQSQQEDQLSDETRVNKIGKKSDLTSAAKLLSIRDEVRIKGYSWDVDTQGEPQASVSSKDTYFTNTDVSNNGIKILRFLGYKIDFTDRIIQMKQAYMQAVIQARSHNFFLAKFAQFKVGLIGQMLAILGISIEELKEIQKKAIQSGIDENITMMAENIYNKELTELIHGTGKKSRKALSILNELQSQLINQMALLGKPEYWNPERLMNERITQCHKILDEFSTEKNALDYQLNFMIQENS